MSWIHLDINDLRQALAEDEIQKLDTLSLTDSSISAMLSAQLDTVADTFRGVLKGKGFKVDVRDHYIAPEYKLFVLSLAREWCWSRFPMSPTIAIDDVRKELFSLAHEQLKNPTVGASDPDWEYDPENPANQTKPSFGSVVLPYLRMNDELVWWHNALSVL